MGDQRIASRDFNPYDLGSVAKVNKELQASGYYRTGYTEPYIPPYSGNDEAPLEQQEEKPKESGE